MYASLYEPAPRELTFIQRKEETELLALNGQLEIEIRNIFNQIGYGDDDEPAARIKSLSMWKMLKRPGSFGGRSRRSSRLV